MATGDATIGYGSVLAINDGSADAYVDVDAIVTLGIPSFTLGTVESKRLSRDVVKLIPGIRKGEPFTITMEKTNAGLVRFKALQYARTEKMFRFTIPDDTGDDEYTFPGIVTAVKPSDVEVEGIQMLEVTVATSDEEQ
jgi:hypothetical protein